jgi:hypothetical protein
VGTVQKFNIGFCPHCLSGFQLPGPDGASGGVGLHSYRNSSGRGSRYVFVAGTGAGKHGTDLEFAAGATHVLVALPQGVAWGPDRTTGIFAIAAFSVLSGSDGHHRVTSPFSATDRYFLFRFAGGDLSQDIYGWAQLEVSSRPHAVCNGPSPGCLDVTLVDYAYDTSGNQIPAGDTGTPEPSTFVLTGLAALALGAKGVRAWRAARESAGLPSG